MKPLTHEWVEKAEGDFVCVEREWRARKSPNYDALCFHAQQCIEKYLKAHLQEAGIGFEKVHNLLVLLKALEPVKPEWMSLRSQLNVLNLYAVAFRYPGESADQETAKEALALCRSLRKIFMADLGLLSVPVKRRRKK